MSPSGTRLQCLTLIAFSSMVTCRTVIKQPPWIRPEPMPEILYQPGALPQIIRVSCPTTAGDDINVTWWRGAEFVSAGVELLFRPLGSRHIGKYHCEAKNTAGISRSRELEVNGVTLQNVDPSTQRLFLMGGQAVSIPCAAPEGYPTPAVRWNSTKSDSAEPLIVDPEGTLHLPSIETRHHGWTLQCSVRQLTESYLIKTLELVVYPRPPECFEDPRFLYVTQHIHMTKQSDALIYCVPSGSSSSISWTVHLRGAKAAIVEDPKYLLRINPATLAVNERYFQVTCKDAGNRLESGISVSVVAEPSILPMSNVSKLEGEEVVLRCYTKGRPKPTIEWFFNNEPIQRRKLDENGIVLPNVTLRDIGVYRCEAFNHLGRTYQELTLSVNRAEPHILADTDCYESVAGDSLLIPCNALAFREPVRTWFKNGVIINGTADDETLELINVQLDDNGNYACQVCERHQRGFSCPLYEFKVRVSPSRLLQTPKKPIVVFENEALNISCIPRFADDVILWRIDDSIIGRGRTLYLDEPQAGTYSCELLRNSTFVTRWDGFVSLRKPAPKIRITEISCRGDGAASLSWTPVENSAFYEILHLHDAQDWRSVEFITNETAANVELSRCSPCLFRVRSHNEMGSSTSETQQCTPPLISGRENIQLLVSNVTVTRKSRGVHISWNSSNRKKLCVRVCAHPPKICQDTFATYTSFSLSNITLKSSFTFSNCHRTGEQPSANAPSIKVYYNCNLTLGITDIRHEQLNSVEIFWNFDSDPCCSLKGHLEIDDTTSSISVDLPKKRFRLENLRENRLYCLKLRASFDGRPLLGSATSESCFFSGQGWELLKEAPLPELRDGGHWISLPNNTLLFHSKSGRFEPLPKNMSQVNLKDLGRTSIKFVQKEDGHCRVSYVTVVNQDNYGDWYLWLVAIVILVGGVSSSAFLLLRRRSTTYEAEVRS